MCDVVTLPLHHKGYLIVCVLLVNIVMASDVVWGYLFALSGHSACGMPDSVR